MKRRMLLVLKICSVGVPSIDKIQQLIGYQPKLSLDDILGRVIEYERGATGC